MKSSPVVLVVESPVVANLVAEVLQKERYTVLLEHVSGGQERLRVGGIDLLITNEPWSFEPFPAGLRVLYLSGAPDREFLLRHPGHRVAFLQKPFRPENLLRNVHSLLSEAFKTA